MPTARLGAWRAATPLLGRFLSFVPQQIDFSWLLLDEELRLADHSGCFKEYASSIRLLVKRLPKHHNIFRFGGTSKVLAKRVLNCYKIL